MGAETVPISDAVSVSIDTEDEGTVSLLLLTYVGDAVGSSGELDGV